MSLFLDPEKLQITDISEIYSFIIIIKKQVASLLTIGCLINRRTTTQLKTIQRAQIPSRPERLSFFKWPIRIPDTTPFEGRLITRFLARWVMCLALLSIHLSTTSFIGIPSMCICLLGAEGLAFKQIHIQIHIQPTSPFLILCSSLPFYLSILIPSIFIFQYANH